MATSPTSIVPMISESAIVGDSQAPANSAIAMSGVRFGGCGKSRTTAPTVTNATAAHVMVHDTVKRLYRHRGTLRLQPENPAVKPLIYSAKALAARDVRVLGRVVSVLRKY